MNKFQKRIIIFISAISILSCVLIFQWIFFVKVDVKYLEDLYSFSQWSVPLSSRIMGDAYLYQHSGIELLKNFEPFSINPETPVFGKLLLGLSIKYTQNPYYFSLLFLLILLITLNYLAKHFFNLNKIKRIILLLLVGTSPIVLIQISDPVMDLPQASLFLVHLYFLFLSSTTKKKNINLVACLLSGLFLGLMTATKIAVYLPFIYLIDTWYLWKKKRIFSAIEIIVASIMTYILLYSPYILKYGVIEWLKTQLWVINFYRNSDVSATPGMVIITAFTGFYKGWWGEGWSRVSLWTGSWGLGVYAVFSQAKNLYLKKISLADEQKYLVFIAISLLIFLSFIPFWPRYFVFFIPLFWLIIISWIKNPKFFLLLLVVPLINIVVIAKNNLQFEPTNFYNLWEKASFKDMYENFSIDYKGKTTREDWHQQNQQEIENINGQTVMLKFSKPTKTGLFNKNQTVILKIIGPKYSTLTEYELGWVLEHAQWKLNSIQKIKTSISHDYTKELPGFICVNPTKVETYSEVHEQLAYFLKITQQEANDKIMSFSPRDYCIPIGRFSERQEEKPIPYLPGVIYKDFKDLNIEPEPYDPA